MMGVSHMAVDQNVLAEEASGEELITIVPKETEAPQTAEASSEEAGRNAGDGNAGNRRDPDGNHASRKKCDPAGFSIFTASGRENAAFSEKYRSLEPSWISFLEAPVSCL